MKCNNKHMAHDFRLVFDKEFDGDTEFVLPSHPETLWDNCDPLTLRMEVISGYG